MSLIDNFNKAAEDVKELKVLPTDENLLELYSLYKQATVGDCNTQRPNMLNFRGTSKWDAWNKLKGMDQDTAREKYIEKVELMVKTIGKK